MYEKHGLSHFNARGNRICHIVYYGSGCACGNLFLNTGHTPNHIRQRGILKPAGASDGKNSVKEQKISRFLVDNTIWETYNSKACTILHVFFSGLKKAT